MGNCTGIQTLTTLPNVSTAWKDTWAMVVHCNGSIALFKAPVFVSLANVGGYPEA